MVRSSRSLPVRASRPQGPARRIEALRRSPSAPVMLTLPRTTRVADVGPAQAYVIHQVVFDAEPADRASRSSIR